jgi:hypothetical protein
MHTTAVQLYFKCVFRFAVVALQMCVQYVQMYTHVCPSTAVAHCTLAARRMLGYRPDIGELPLDALSRRLAHASRSNQSRRGNPQCRARLQSLNVSATSFDFSSSFRSRVSNSLPQQPYIDKCQQYCGYIVAVLCYLHCVRHDIGYSRGVHT